MKMDLRSREVMRIKVRGVRGQVGSGDPEHMTYVKDIKPKG